MRVVLDTNTVLSAILFPKGRLLWLREVWKAGRIVPIVNRATVQELIRVLAYPKFKLSQEEIETSLDAYLPYAEMVASPPEDMSDPPSCRDEDDQPALAWGAS